MSRESQKTLVEYAQEFLNTSDTGLPNVVDEFLKNYRLEEKSETAIRKIHSIVTRIIDRVMEGKGSSHDIAHAEIFIKYQSVRKQISREMADAIILVLKAVSNSLNESHQQMIKTARRARLFLDALITLSRMR